MLDTVIIGSGPAGYSAGIYAGRANLSTVIVASSVEPGGALTTTTDVENYPGFDEGVMGPELMKKMQKQAERFGAKVIYDDVIELELAEDIKRITLGNGDVLEALTVIYATGSAYRTLGVPHETEFIGAGVSYCGTCDAAFFKNQTVAVVGGGDSAVEEAIFLTKFASKVYLVHRRATLRASQAVQAKAFANPKIELVWDSEVESIIGDDGVDGVVLKHGVTGAKRELAVTGLFIAIGSDPRTHLIHESLELTQAGTIAVQGRSSVTSQAGVFAAGDVIDPVYRQAGVAAGSGIVAALDAQAYLESSAAREYSLK